MHYTKEVIRGLLNLIGLEIHSRNKYRTMDTLLQQTVRQGFSPSTVIDVGVGRGTPELYRNFPAATHLLIEPLKEWEADLKNICQQYNGIYVLSAAGAEAGETVIQVFPDGLGSMIFIEKQDRQSPGVPRNVPVVRLDEVCRQKKLEGPFVVKADVQGYELEVIAGAKDILPQVELIILETSFFEFHKGWPQFYEVVTKMKDFGYVVYDICTPTARPLDQALGFVDLAFVKEFGQFRSSHQYM